MEKNIGVYKEYESCVKDNLDFFQRYYYHSMLDLNLVKLAKVLEEGLLVRKNLKDGCLFTEPLNSYNCKNGENFISISHCLGKFPLNEFFQAFALHALTSPSVMINRNIVVQNYVQHGESFLDELFVHNGIKKANFEGIMLPEHLSHQLIKDINPLFANWMCLKKEYIEAWMNLLDNYFKSEFDREKVLFMVDDLIKRSKKYQEKIYKPNWNATDALNEQKDEIKEDLKEVMAYVMQELWDELLGEKNVLYIDVINYINRDNLPIYKLTRKRII